MPPRCSGCTLKLENHRAGTPVASSITKPTRLYLPVRSIRGEHLGRRSLVFQNRLQSVQPSLAVVDLELELKSQGVSGAFPDIPPWSLSCAGQEAPGISWNSPLSRSCCSGNGVALCACVRSTVAKRAETGSHHVAQAGLELLSSSDPPSLASQCWDHRHEPARPACRCFLNEQGGDRVLLCHPCWSAMVQSRLTAVSTSQIRHLQQHESGVEGESCYYHCVLCNYSTKAKLNLIQHVRSMKHQRSESLRKLQRLQKGLPEEDEDLGQIFTIRRCPSTDPGPMLPLRQTLPDS
ncbi:Zinc finger homeobox protein 3 [Plecturocebus cupreus]